MHQNQSFDKGEPALAGHLVKGLVLAPPFVSGGVAGANRRDRAEVLSGLQTLPAAILASNAEVLQLVEDRCLWGRGLGWIDLHLLASALLSKCGFWTLDKRLAQAGKELGLSWTI